MSCIHQCDWRLPQHYPNASAKVQLFFQITKNLPCKITFSIDLILFEAQIYQYNLMFRHDF